MNTWNNRSIRQRGSQLVTPEFQKLVTIHTAISLGILLAITIFQTLLGSFTANQSGLAGLGTSAVFMTASSTLGTIYNLLMPFWQLGVLYIAIRQTRRQESDLRCLTRGFQRWGVVIRFYLLLFIGSFVIVMLLSNVLAIGIGLLVPLYSMMIPVPENMAQVSAQMEEKMMTFAETADFSVLAGILPTNILLYVLPLCLLVLAVCFGLMLHLYYRLRFSQFLMVDDPAVGARQAIGLSNQMTKGNKWNLFKLDLSFWWYALLQMAVSLIAEIPLFVNLPMSGKVAQLVFLAISYGAQIGITWVFGARMQATFACAYDQLRTPPQSITVDN